MSSSKRYEPPTVMKTPQPYKAQNTGINKSLLTPCRRMGLAKKSPGSCHLTIHSPVIDVRDTILSYPMTKTIDDNRTAQNKENKTAGTCEYKHSGRHYKTSRSRFANKLKIENFNEKLEKQISDDLQESIKCEEEDEVNQCSIASTFQESNQHEQPEEINLGNTLETCKTLDVINEESRKTFKCVSENITEEMLEELRQRVKQKEEKAEELKLAQLYKKKHDLSRLSILTERWRSGCQEALRELLSASQAQGYQLDMLQLLAKLGIPHHLVGYNQEQEDFT